MHLSPLISLSGKTQWSISCSSPNIEDSTVRISISLHSFADGQDALKIVGDQMANAEFDWMYVYNGRIRIDADVARDDLGNWGKRILWCGPIVRRPPPTWPRYRAPVVAQACSEVSTEAWRAGALQSTLPSYGSNRDITQPRGQDPRIQAGPFVASRIQAYGRRLCQYCRWDHPYRR